MLSRLERVGALLTLTTFFAYLVAPLVRLAEQPIRLRGWLVLIPVLAFFLLKDAHRFRRADVADGGKFKTYERP